MNDSCNLALTMTKHLHILGICGTFMAGIALLAKAKGFRVSGSDENVYPPMSTQLEAAGITLYQGYDEAQLQETPDIVVVGNVISRGNPAIEAVLNRGIPYTSGPQWLAENVLRDRWVLAVSGTHGKTTTSSLLAWLLEAAGLAPGFLIGGVPENFGVSARLGDAQFFVIEADEYDSAFFDKRSKFVHYHPKTLILNNLEFDHADIFDSLADIQKQFHHLVRTVPSEGLMISAKEDHNLEAVLEKGCWTPVTRFGESKTADWSYTLVQPSGAAFNVLFQGKSIPVNWGLLGTHNVQNAVAAIAAAHHVGVDPHVACEALSHFKNVKRRLECRGVINTVTVYDDFAHHPTAVATTLQGLRAHLGTQRIIAVLELGSFTMRHNVHGDAVFKALSLADNACVFLPKDWPQAVNVAVDDLTVARSIDSLLENVMAQVQPGDHVLVMSNTGFQGFHDKLLKALEQHAVA